MRLRRAAAAHHPGRQDLKTGNDALKQRVAELEKSDAQALLRRIAELERR
jgi:hypothetical protein